MNGYHVVFVWFVLIVVVAVNVVIGLAYYHRHRSARQYARRLLSESVNNAMKIGSAPAVPSTDYAPKICRCCGCDEQWARVSEVSICSTGRHVQVDVCRECFDQGYTRFACDVATELMKKPIVEPGDPFDFGDDWRMRVWP